MSQLQWPSSLRELNELPEKAKVMFYRTLLPEWLFTTYGVDQDTLTVNGKPVAIFRCPTGSRAAEISVRRRADDIDPMLYLHMADSLNNQILVLLVVINDPDAPRFNVDVDEQGRPTQLGTQSRNLQAEEAAMKAGLLPGQVRAGLRVFRQMLPMFEQFMKNLGHDLFLIEPLSYHNAIISERYGFGYMRGQQEMRQIDREFRPGGRLHSQLTPDNVFRHPDAWKTIRGRSWAIHDGILGEPFTGVQMYKRIGHETSISTFPDAQW